MADPENCDEAETTLCMKRRRFLEGMAASMGGVVFAGMLAPIAFYLAPSERGQSGSGGPMLAAKADDIKVNEAKAVMFGTVPVLVVHTAAGWVALKAACPHLGCVVRWEPDKQGISCPCHGAVFDTRGQVLSGPSPGPLPQVPIKQVGDKIYIGEA